MRELDILKTIAFHKTHIRELQKKMKKNEKIVEMQRQKIGGLLDENRRLLDNLKIITTLNKAGVTAEIVDGVVLPSATVSRAATMSNTITIPDEFYQIGKNLREQDNRCTDQPMFVVFQKREIIGSDEHSPSRIVWVLDGDEVEELRSKRLELLYHDGRDTSRYDRYAMQEIDVFVTACFTEQGCKDYLQRNGHNLRQPFIYAAGSYRNNEYQEVRNWLMSLPEGGDHA